MAIDQIGLCNLALDAMGARATIASISENSAEAAACARQYQPALEAVLQAAHWNFARKQTALTLVKDGTLANSTVPTPWLYEYAVPSDMLQPRYIMPTSAGSSPYVGMGTPGAQYPVSAPVRFIVGSDLDQNNNPTNVILTNQAQAILVYTWRVNNPNLLDSQFVTAFFNYLAHCLTLPLSGDKGLSKACFDKADLLCRRAQASDGNAGLTVIDHIPDWITARGFIYDTGHTQDGMFILPPQNLIAVS